MTDALGPLLREIEGLFTVDTAQLKHITDHFVSELQKGLGVEGGSIPMNPTWVMSLPNGYEIGTYLALDLGGTNLRVYEITLTEQKSKFNVTQSQYRIPEDLKTGEAEGLWSHLAICIEEFLETHHGNHQELQKLPLGFIFSYPVTQDYVDEGILQRWTKGFDIAGVEGKNVVQAFTAALAKRQIPVVLTALTNDTTATMIASAYTDAKTKIGCIFGTGCNAAYMEDCGSIPKLASMSLPPNMPMIINCEWGAFDNEHKVLPRTQYDIIIDENSPRPRQQAFEKMIAGLYLGEIFRLVMVDVYNNKTVSVFEGQDITKLQRPYSLDSSFLSAIEEDLSEDFRGTHDLFLSQLNISCTQPELKLTRRIAELVSTRAARLSACGVAAICKKKGYQTCHVGAEGSLFEKHPYFKAQMSQALREILDWRAKTSADKEDPIDILASDGSGVGAAVIAALTLKRVQEGNLSGVLHPENFKLQVTRGIA